MSARRALFMLCLAALAFGLLYRLFPLALGGRTLSGFFITEDGYLMLTVARNMAIGLGMTVSGGEIATNGIQPLATFLFTLPYFATGGDKLSSLAGIVGISALISGLAAWAVWGFAKRLLPAALPGQDPDDTRTLAALVTALWFVGPLLVFHSMNALETGLYTLIVVVTALVFFDIVARGGTYRLTDQILLGVLSGLVFLARVDGAFFVTAIFLARFVQIQVTRQASFWGAVKEALPPGLISLACAAPWLIYNYNLFGSIIPISGQAQSETAAFASNLALAPVKLLETMLPMLPVPTSLEGSLPLAYASGGAVALVVALFLVIAFRRPRPLETGPMDAGRADQPHLATAWRTVAVAYALYTAALFAYYSLYFGAPHFLSRYFAPLAPFLILAVIAVGAQALALITRSWAQVVSVAGLAALVLSLALIGRLVLPGAKEQGHFQVVDWIAENVAEDQWVGAIQTGTLGYWHDRTINLDGKVNPNALRARQEDGNVLGYVLETPIAFLADWPGIAAWVENNPDHPFGRAFVVEVKDVAKNLAVLRRRDATPSDT